MLAYKFPRRYAVRAFGLSLCAACIVQIATPAVGESPRPNVLLILAHESLASSLAATDLRPKREISIGGQPRRRVRSGRSPANAVQSLAIVVFDGSAARYARSVVQQRSLPRSCAPDVVTLPEYFKQQGYVTRDVGKILQQPGTCASTAIVARGVCLSSCTTRTTATIGRCGNRRRADGSGHGTQLPPLRRGRRGVL